MLALPASAEPTDISVMQVERADKGLVLSAQVRFELPAVVEDALLKGIPMVFVAEATVLKDRWYWYDKEVAQATRYMRLSYQPLTRRWRLQVSSTPITAGGLTLGQNFDAREEALAALQRISGWKIAADAEIDPGAVHRVVLRFALDVSQLPRPFQIGVVGQPEWSISATEAARVPPEGAR
ncbi:DUF4390 domain-containing protein [Ramlibacter rhizophilus]|uniref:DUF4390 domain-containing protein n=2 Tax=Ramlibacter rhizophilus TaxID=1781167 RepID=A0A4Z0BDZ4_9BURK|nr:DUF4390 domain-containing protein [Ramlibacter rhizophilus]